MQALFVGRTILGDRVLDVERGIELLRDAGSIDMSRVGILGQSAGGMTALFAGALLEPLRVVVVSGAFSRFEDSILAMPHCVDNYIPRLAQNARVSDIAGLIAPRSLIVVAGEHDGLFPAAGARTAFREVRRIYAAASSSTCHLVIGQGGHRFYSEAWPLIRNALL